MKLFEQCGAPAADLTPQPYFPERLPMPIRY